MGVEHQVALEAQEQVLAVGVDAPDPAAIQTLGPAVERMTGVGRADLVRDASFQHRANPVGVPGEVHGVPVVSTS